MSAPASVFVSHGSPMIALERGPASDFLRRLGAEIPKPRAVLAASAHWPTKGFRVGGAAAPVAVHDFWGFPPELYAQSYPAAGDPAAAAAIADAVGGRVDAARGLDHGIWTVLGLMWPDADVPVIPLSVDRFAGAAAHMELGAKLRPFVDEGMLVLGSGAATHNLSGWTQVDRDAPAEPWVSAFADDLERRILADDRDGLADWTRVLPHARDNHPDDDHLSPLFVALGAGRGRGRALHRSVEHATIAMDVYAWD